MESTLTLFNSFVATGTRTKVVLGMALLVIALVALSVLAGDASAGQKFR